MNKRRNVVVMMVTHTFTIGVQKMGPADPHTRRRNRVYRRRRCLSQILLLLCTLGVVINLSL